MVWSKFFNNIVHVADCEITYQNSIRSIWICKETDTKYANYWSSGLRPITDGLFIKLLRDARIKKIRRRIGVVHD